MCRTVADAAVLLSVIAGPDPRDPVTLTAPAMNWDLASILNADGLRGARIGVMREHYWGFHPEVERLAEQALDALRAAGAEIVDPANLPTAEAIAGGWPPSATNPRRTVLQYEFKAGIAAYLSERDGAIRNVDDIIAWNAAHSDLEMPWFGQELLEQSVLCGELTDPVYLEALAYNRRVSREEGIDAILQAHQLDALVAPTGAPAWKIDLLNGGGGTHGGCSTPPAVAGYPVITVPMGSVHGMPVGFSFIGTAWSDISLLRLAYAFEQATNARFAPRFQPAGVLPPA
jgi:amidase